MNIFIKPGTYVIKYSTYTTVTELLKSIAMVTGEL